jgi:hypothetical protein
VFQPIVSTGRRNGGRSCRSRLDSVGRIDRPDGLLSPVYHRRMARKRKQNWKSLDWLLRRLKAEAKKICLTREVLPPDIADDPGAVLEWMRGRRRRESQGRRHGSKAKP